MGSLMQHLDDAARWAADRALWDLLTFVLALAGLGLWAVFYKRRVWGFALFPTYRFGAGHSLYPNVIYLTARNQRDVPIVVSRPNFRFAGELKAGDNAHGNLATGDYELKFRKLDRSYQVRQGDSYSTILLYHRQSAMAYIPIDDDLDEQGFIEMLRRKTLLGRPRPVGWVYFDIVLLAEGKPKVVRMKQPLTAVVKETRDLALGYDPNGAGEGGAESSAQNGVGDQ